MHQRVVRAISIATAFWEAMAESPLTQQYITSFPRNMEALILYGLEIPVKYVNDLTVFGASKYLCALRGEAFAYDSVGEDRALYGLLHVGPPCNIVFVRNNLDALIKNYILAHELGHILADIFLVRNLWLRSLPEQRLEIVKAFAWQEFDPCLELVALVRGLPLRPRAQNGPKQTFTDQTIEQEITADLVARELLAPWSLVLPSAKRLDRKSTLVTLRQDYGLPWRIAESYYQDLSHQAHRGPDLFTRLFAPFIDPQD